MKRFYYTIFFCCQIGLAQVGINTTLPMAQLDIRSSNQAAPANTDGLLIPKMDAFPATNPTASQQGMLVYLTTTSGSSTPGFYYWDNTTTAWVGVGGNSNSWNLGGNSGINTSTQFLGTTDNKDLIFKRAGAFAGKLGTNNTFFGSLSGSVATGTNNTYIGVSAGEANVSGQENVFLGRGAGSLGTTGSDNVLIGNGAGVMNTANQNSFVGAFSGNGNTIGANNSFFGYFSGTNNSGMRNTFLGAFTGSANTTGSDNTLIGNNTNFASGTLSNATAIGSNALVSASNSIILGSINGVNSSTASTSVGIGTTSPKGVLDVTSDTNGILIPRVALTATTTQAPVVDPQGGTLQTSTLVYNTATASDVYPGFYFWNGSNWVRFDADGENNPKYYTATGTTSVGIPSTYTLAPQMEITFTPKDDLALVHFSASGFSSSGSCGENPVFFRLLLNGVTVTGWQSTAEVPSGVTNVRPIWNANMHIPVAVTIGVPQTISVYWSTACTSLANIVATPFSAGSGNVYYANRTLTVIDPNGGGGIVGTAPVTTNMWSLNGNGGTNSSANFLGTIDSQPLVLKSNNTEGLRVGINGNVYMPLRLGIGTFTPFAALDVTGSLRMNDGFQGTGKVMTSDSNGIGGWEAVTNIAWGINGNTGTDPATDFIGTTDNKALAIRTNNTEQLRITETGEVGIGTSTPLANLELRTTTPVFRVAADDANIAAMQLYEMTSGNPFGYQFQYDGNTDKLHLWSKGFSGNDAVRMTWLKDGSIGVGTASPLTRFEIHDDNKVTAATTRGNLHVMATNAQAIDVGGSLTLGGYYDNTATTMRVFGSLEGRKANSTNTSSSGYLQFKTNNSGNLTEKMRITETGDVGIGTTAPQSKLEIAAPNVATTATVPGTLNVMSTSVQNSDVGGSITLGGYRDDAATTFRVFGSIEGRKSNATTGSSNGYLAFKTDNAGTLAERIRITNAGDVGIGTTTPGGLFELSLDEGRKPGTTTWTVTSDARLKNISGDYTLGMNEIRRLHPVRYHYKNAGSRTFDKAVLETEFSGFIAQDVQRIFPNCVSTDEDGYLSLNLHDILIASVNALKELDAKNAQLQSENEQLRQKILEHDQLLQAIMAELQKRK